MKKILFALLCLPSVVLAAQQEITVVPDNPVIPSIGSLKDAVNLRLADIDENFDEIYPILTAGPVHVNTTAPADTKVVWIDTDQDNAIKVYIGGVWTVVGTAGSDDNLGSATYSDVVALWTTCTGYLKSDGTCDTPSGSATYPSAAGVANWNGSAWGTSYTVGTASNNLVRLNASAQLPAVSGALLTNLDYSNISNPPATQELSAANMGWNNQSDFETWLGWSFTGDSMVYPSSGNFAYTADGSSYSTMGLDTDLSSTSANDDTVPSAKATKAALDIIALGGVTVQADDPTASSEEGWYAATGSGDIFYKTTNGLFTITGSYVALDATPAAFSFVDQTDVELSTETTSAAVQITDINTAAAVSATDGTAAICTSADLGDCGTFGVSPGNVPNNGYIRARHTSSSSNSTAVNTTVSVGGVSDTFTSTTVSGGVACTGSRLLYAEFENSDTITSGTPAGCSAGADTTWTLSGATYTDAWSNEGTYSLLADANFDTATISITDRDIGDEENGRVVVSIYIDTTANGEIFKLTSGTTNHIIGDIVGSEVELIYRDSEGTSSVITSNCNLATETAYNLVFQWRQGTTDPSMRVACYDASNNLIEAVTSDANLFQWAQSPVSWVLFDSGGTTGRWKIDSLHIYNTYED